MTINIDLAADEENALCANFVTREDDAVHCIHDYSCSDDDEDDGIGCCYPDECCMPGLHMLSECHTAADVEAQNADPDEWPEDLRVREVPRIAARERQGDWYMHRSEWQIIRQRLRDHQQQISRVRQHLPPRDQVDVQIVLGTLRHLRTTLENTILCAEEAAEEARP